MPAKPKSKNPQQTGGPGPQHPALPSHSIATASPASGQTANERSAERYHLTRPFAKRLVDPGIARLSEADRRSLTHSLLLYRACQAASAAGSASLFSSQKTEREFWKTVSRDALPLPTRQLSASARPWGPDSTGADLGLLPAAALDRRLLDLASLTALEVLSRAAGSPQGLSQDLPQEENEAAVRKPEQECEQDRELERTRRVDMALLKSDLFGEKIGTYALDPDWDDVVPVPQNEPEGALASIAYPDDYAEAMSYLRAVMTTHECSPRCLRLTQDVIDMNPAHYTVWLYRFQIISTLELPVADELEWLNSVALSNLKNYQIWHHRQMLVDHELRRLGDDSAALPAMAESETGFLDRILAEDAKNYHVWSYRQYLVKRLGNWSAAELATTEALIAADVRNNSAWAHRFFLVFSDPAHSSASPGRATDPDPAVPPALIDRELHFARYKIAVAPQSQSAWNYLRGVLAKGGRPLADAEDVAAPLVTGLDPAATDEVVRSTHALDLLADVWEERGDVPMASLCWTRLTDKWDPIRAGYWRYRIRRAETRPRPT